MNTTLPPLTIQTLPHPFEIYSDQREHGYQGPSRHVRLARVTPAGGGVIAKSEDGTRCAVTGKESLRILRMSDPSQASKTEHKSATGIGGHRIDASRNFWDASGLKIDSASTDIAWGRGPFSDKIMTSARNGELIMWDLNKPGTTKYERRTRESNRCINKMAMTQHANHYCITGAVDGQLRVWDLRNITKSLLHIAHPSSIRSLVFSPVFWNPVQVAVGLDSGTIHRWDLRMGQRGQLDKLPVAHSGSVTALEWYSSSSAVAGSIGVQGPSEVSLQNNGWLASGGLDRCVKVWDMNTNTEHMPHKPTYTLRTAFPIRKLAWRPGYECELAIVSNNDYLTHTLDVSANPGASLTRVSSGMALDTPKAAEVLSIKDNGASLLSAAGDAVEIWDVRRGYIAKWRVTGSASEGGATDITFGDGHALWTQHASGTFSQLDLRNVTKPIDAIPRSAMTWDVSGSVAFAVDPVERCEVPYDDIHPDQQAVIDLRRPPVKVLGDPPHKITTQAVGTYANEFATIDVEMLKTLARRYIFEGRERQEICAYNAGVASSAGHEAAAQAWLLLGASLAQFLPPPPSMQPPQTKKVPSPLLPSTSSPHQSSVINGYTFPPSTGAGTSPDFNNSNTQRSPSLRSASVSLSRMASHSASIAGSSRTRLTPTSSTTSSPRHLPVPLPSLTPRYESFLGRRDSIDRQSLGLGGPSSLMLRRPSLPATPLQSSSPSERSSLRHVGEGVLDDSDSGDSDCGGDGEDEEGEDTAGVNSSDEDGAPGVQVLSPGLSGPRGFPVPSPLSRIAGRQSWTDDTEEESGEHRESDADDSDDGEHDVDERDEAFEGEWSTPSPQSTDTDSAGEQTTQPRRTRSTSNAHASARTRRWSSVHNKKRSHSSTIASLAASRSLSHHDSHSSIRTVTAAGGEENRESAGKTDTVARHQASAGFHTRPKSRPVSELAVNAGTANRVSSVGGRGLEASQERSQMTERRIESIRFEDRRFRETTLSALKVALDEFADEGDVQMCAMLSLVASKELAISLTRSTRFLESYIELLCRLRLYTCAAYIRKYCGLEAIQKPTMLGTTIYTSCGKCRKPLLRPAGSNKGTVPGKGAFSYCMGCRQSSANCSICRLPVRALLFQCSVCNHGGHQECYRQYYFQHSMVELPTSFPARDSRGRTTMRSSPPMEDILSQAGSSQIISLNDSTSQGDNNSISSAQSGATDTTTVRSQTHHLPQKLAGHPCAAGCGHYCWAANMSDGVADLP